MIKPNLKDGFLFFILGLITFIIGLFMNNSIIYKIGLYTAIISEFFIGFILVMVIVQYYWKKIKEAYKDNPHRHENN